MACNKIKPPSPPTLEESMLPPGLNLPRGGTLEQIKSLASGQGLSNAMNNVSGLISSNVSKLGNALSPDALAGRVTGAIQDITDEIGSRVNQAIDGVKNLPNRLSDLIPKSPSFGLPGKAEFAEMQESLGVGKCGEQYIKQASQVTGSIGAAATSAASQLSPKELRDMKNNTKTEETKAEQIQQEVTQQATETATTQAAVEDKNEKTVQNNVQSPVIETKVREKEQTKNLLVDSYISPPEPAWGADVKTIYYDSILGYLKPHIESFKSKVGTGEPPSGDVHAHTHDASIEMSDSDLDNSSVVNGGEIAYNFKQAQEVFFEFLGAGQEGSDWDQSDKFCRPNRHISLFIQSYVVSSTPDRFRVGQVVNAQVHLQLMRTVTPGTSIFGNYEIESMFITRKALGKDHMNGYKMAVDYALSQFLDNWSQPNYLQWFGGNFNI